MGWFDVIDSFAKGTLVEDTLQRIDDGLDAFDRIVGEGEKQITNLADNLEKGVTTVVDSADRVVAGADKTVEQVELVSEKAGKVMDVVKKLPSSE